MRIGHVATVHRYPVKSVLGERLDSVEVDGRGLVGDRLFSVRDPDGRFGSGKSTRRFRRMDGLQLLRARYEGDDVVLELPDGTVVRGRDAARVADLLSAHVGRPVTLAREGEVSHFDDGPVHLVTTASLSSLASARGVDVDPGRCRPNLVVDTGDTGGYPEDDWLGRTLAVGDHVRLRVVQPMPRCVMATHATADLPADATMLRDVTDLHGGDLGVLADVLRGGTLRVDDPVALLPS